MSGELVALNTNWLDAGEGTVNANYCQTLTGGVYDMSGGSITTWTNGCWCHPTSDRRPIRLGYSEIERLRAAAKRDAKLKKILQKFTDQIEVVVDFE